MNFWQKRSIFTAFLVLFTSQAALAQIFQVDQPSEQVKVLETREIPELGVVPSRIEVTDPQTGKSTTLALSRPSSDDVKVLLALRLKVPELFGVRAGVSFNDSIEVGIDAGYGLFFNGVGLYLNYYPEQGNFYLGGRAYHGFIWTVFDVAQYSTVEGVLGYRFISDSKTGIYGFLEGGVAGLFAGGDQGKDPITGVIPSISLGLGYAF